MSAVVCIIKVETIEMLVIIIIHQSKDLIGKINKEKRDL